MTDVKIPTRIVKDLGLRKNANNIFVRWFLCDDDREYTIKDMAKVIGLAGSTIHNRLSLYGWESERILDNTGKPVPKKVDDGDLARLGTSSRKENMSKLRPLGTFERQGLV
ncbi:MAG: hypothetical protein KJ990_12610 [Proteobacteria bacterium]|nr:hypothetical protein [Pseudomonadota bacterium]MBU1648220.1 hypothetical protein [Pseudomonadota bacterium]